MKESDISIADVIIVGGGLSGMLLAHVLAKQPFIIFVVERNETYPDNFRAEKFEPAQWALINKFGLCDLISPAGEPTGEIITYENGKLISGDGSEQYGFRYSQTVNRFRQELPDNVKLIKDEVISVSYRNDICDVQLTNNEFLKGRLTVIAAGGVQKLAATLGLKYHRDSRLRSLSFGFDIKPLEAFKFRGFTYICEEKSHGVDYVSCFMIGAEMRVNVFTQWHPKDERVKLFRQNTKNELIGYFPKLEEYLGGFEVSSRVQTFPTEYYRLKHNKKNGVAVIADEFQSVSPTTGTGLSKLTVEVDVLSRLISEWLNTTGMSWSKIRKFYNHEEKLKADFESYSSWVYYLNLYRNSRYLRKKYRILSLYYFWRVYLNRVLKKLQNK